MAELVGVLNMTPDSFSDGGQNSVTEDAVERAEELYIEGASIVDVGAESTRPGAKPLTWQEEVARLDGFVQKAQQNGWRISLDTYHPETVRWASSHLTKFIINDVTGFRDETMRQAAAELGERIIVSHLPISSSDIQGAHKDKPVESEAQVIDELESSIQLLAKAGVRQEDIILDPGIGFGKTMELNWKLLEFAKLMPDYDVMIGYSRKRFLGEDRMEIDPNLEAGRIAIAAGAKYLRVHDVAGHAPLVS